jgi:anti-sigma B factor antagonist
MESDFIVSQIDRSTIVEFRIASLMDPVQLETIGSRLYKLIDEEDHRHLILDFSNVQYLSSQAIGIVMSIYKKVSALKRGNLILCGINDKLAELLRITRLDKVLTVKASQKEALQAMVRAG